MEIEYYLRQEVEKIRSVGSFKWKKFLLMPLEMLSFLVKMVRDSAVKPRKKLWQKVVYPYGALVLMGLTLGEIIMRYELSILPSHFVLNIIEIMIFGFILSWFLMVCFGYASLLMDREWTKRRKKVIRRRRKKGYPIRFSTEQYREAEAVLRKLRPISYEKAEEKYGKDVWEILVLANVVWCIDKKWRRLVSIKAIEADREAGEEDE